MGLTAKGEVFVDKNYNYQQITTAVDGTTVVTAASIETSHELVLHQETNVALARAACLSVPSDADLYVHGDVVRVRGRIEVPGRAIRIVCRRLEAEPSTDGRAPAIIVDGRPGETAPGSLGKAPSGSPGSPGTYKKPPP